MFISEHKIMYVCVILLILCSVLALKKLNWQNIGLGRSHKLKNWNLGSSKKITVGASPDLSVGLAAHVNVCIISESGTLFLERDSVTHTCLE